MYLFQDKVAVITGGTSGLGRAISLEFAKSGATVVVAGRREEEGEKTVRQVEEFGSKALFIRCDVTKTEDVKNLMDITNLKYGKIDFAVNNAGYYGNASFLSNYEEEEFDKVININLKGVWLSMKYELQSMLRSGSGSIVNISSVNGLISMPFGVSAYSASKHGIIGLTKSAALEVAKKNIRVNAVCPGGIETEMLSNIFKNSPDPQLAEKIFLEFHPFKRFAKPIEVAKSVVWLCSDSASYINGVSLPVDGGLTAH